MNFFLEDLRHYIKEVMGMNIEPRPMAGKGILPIFLNNLYDFYSTTMNGKSFVLVVSKGEKETPGTIWKHLEQIQNRLKKLCIYVCRVISSYDRKRLMQYGIQFIIPHKQIYLVGVGIDYLEHCRLWREQRYISKLSPSTQAVVLYVFIHKKWEFFSLELANILQYTPMTMSRAIVELESLGLGITEKRGKERWFSFFKQGNALWEQVQSFLRNPVFKSVWVKAKKTIIAEIKDQSVLAGLSALAEQSLLSAPKCPVYAIYSEEWKKLEQLEGIEQIPSPEDADIEIEIWRYDPKLFAVQGIIDPFSLILSLQEIHDERVEITLEKLIEKIKW